MDSPVAAGIAVPRYIGSCLGERVYWCGRWLMDGETVFAGGPDLSWGQSGGVSSSPLQCLCRVKVIEDIFKGTRIDRHPTDQSPIGRAFKNQAIVCSLNASLPEGE